MDTAYERGWSDVKNSELLDEAEDFHYDLLITTDQNLYHQQNLSERRIAVLVLTTTSWPRMKEQAGKIKTRVDELDPGHYEEISIE